MHGHIKYLISVAKREFELGCLWARNSFMELISDIRPQNIYDVIKLLGKEMVFSAVEG